MEVGRKRHREIERFMEGGRERELGGSGRSKCKKVKLVAQQQQRKWSPFVQMPDEISIVKRRNVKRKLHNPSPQGPVSWRPTTVR